MGVQLKPAKDEYRTDISAVCFSFHNLWNRVGISKKDPHRYNEGVERSGQMFEQSIVKVSERKFRTKKEIIAYLSQLAAAAGKIDDMDRYITAVLQREETASTAVGFKIAIPHGESDAVTQTFVACVQLKHPVVWDHDEVDLVFMIGVPLSSRNKEHLRILAMLCRHLMKEDFRRELREAKTDDEFYERIKFLENER